MDQLEAFSISQIGWKKGHLSQDRKSSEQLTCFNCRNHEMKTELALSGIVPSMMSNANQEEAI
jgi:hypothetical protein